MTLKGQTPPSTRSKAAADQAAATAGHTIVWARYYANADEWLKGLTKQQAMAAVAAYATIHGQAAGLMFLVEVNAAIMRRDADPERAARIAERRAAKAVAA